MTRRHANLLFSDLFTRQRILFEICLWFRRFWSNRAETEALSQRVMLPFRATKAPCVILTLVNLPVFAGHFQISAGCGASGVGAERTFLLTRDAGTHRSVHPRP